MNSLFSLLPANITKALKVTKNTWEWRGRNYGSPAPQKVKEAILRKYSVPGAQWVETGTYLGHTTRFLAGIAPKVFTIEPSEKIHNSTKKSLAGIENIECLLGTSEDIFPELLPKLEGNCNFWLDGHFSAGETFKGKSVCPVPEELAAIEAHLDRLGSIAILIDDVRLFCDVSDRDPEYPSIDLVAQWAIEKGFSWTIEHDIFICKR